MKATHSLSIRCKSEGLICRYQRLTDGRILVTTDQEPTGGLIKRTSLFMSDNQLGVFLNGGVDFVQNESGFLLPNPIDIQL